MAPKKAQGKRKAAGSNSKAGVSKPATRSRAKATVNTTTDAATNGTTTTRQRVTRGAARLAAAAEQTSAQTPAPEPSPPSAPAPAAPRRSSRRTSGATPSTTTSEKVRDANRVDAEPPLFTHKSEKSIFFKDDDVTLGTSLVVSNTRIMTDLFLRYAFEITINGEHAGQIDAFRIAKPNSENPVASEAWLEALVRHDLSADPKDEDDEVKTLQHEAGLMTQALWKRDGVLRASVLGEARTPLRDRKLLYVQLVHIMAEFQKAGLVQVMFDELYDALTELPEWFAVHRAVFVLVPDPTVRFNDDFAEGTSDEQVRAILWKTYQKVGYQFYVKKVGVGRAANKEEVTVMGRTVG